MIAIPPNIESFNVANKAPFLHPAHRTAAQPASPPQLISVLWLQSFCCGHLLKLIPVFCNHQPPLHWRQLPLWHLPCPLHTLLFSKWSALGTLWHHHHQFPPWVNWNAISAIPKQTLVCTVHYLTNPHSICMELVRTFSSVLMTNSFLILASWQAMQFAWRRVAQHGGMDQMWNENGAGAGAIPWHQKQMLIGLPNKGLTRSGMMMEVDVVLLPHQCSWMMTLVNQYSVIMSYSISARHSSNGSQSRMVIA